MVKLISWLFFFLLFLYGIHQSEFKKLAFFLVIFHSHFKLFQINGLCVFSQQKVNNFLLEVVFHVLFVESIQGLKSMIHHSHQISLPCSGHIRMCWPCACVMFGNHVPIIRPYVFQVYDELVGVLVIICRIENRTCFKNILDIKSALYQNCVKHI